MEGNDDWAGWQTANTVAVKEWKEQVWEGWQEISGWGSETGWKCETGLLSEPMRPHAEDSY